MIQPPRALSTHRSRSQQLFVTLTGGVLFAGPIVAHLFFGLSFLLTLGLLFLGCAIYAAADRYVVPRAQVAEVRALITRVRSQSAEATRSQELTPAIEIYESADEKNRVPALRLTTDGIYAQHQMTPWPQIRKVEAVYQFEPIPLLMNPISGYVVNLIRRTIGSPMGVRVFSSSRGTPVVIGIDSLTVAPHLVMELLQTLVLRLSASELTPTVTPAATQPQSTEEFLKKLSHDA